MTNLPSPISNLYPLTFTPVLKPYIWGGRNLERLFGRTLPPGKTAESWEIAAHPHGTTSVENGPYAGLLLTELQARLGVALLGRQAAWAQARGVFPLLVKLLDAQEPLSVQVHPDDDYAMRHEGNELGKTEMWLFLHAEPEAAVILGLKAGVTPAILRQAIQDGALAQSLHHIAVKTGDFLCVPSGSVHAMLGGVVLAEIQQNSDATYRLYDWNRVGPDGQGRPLHVEQALAVINFNQTEPQLPRPRLILQDNNRQVSLLCRNNYFVVERWTMAAATTYHGQLDGSSLEIWGVIQGAATLNGGGYEVALPAARFILLPAQLGRFHITVISEGQLLRIYLPPDHKESIR